MLSKIFRNKRKEPSEFSEEMINEAKKTPGGWIYQIEGSYNENEYTPPGAIVGAWQVDNGGIIIAASFKPNPNYRSDLKGRKFSDKEQYDKWLSENT